ncbi:MAG: hypothetical protein K2L73_02290 [Muribaculaceae bacterium]|nr:hypothetical protein [Muribaculaceae bacterium]
MAELGTDAIDKRQKFVEAWNKTMIDIWTERISKLKVFDTGTLWRSPVKLPVRADGRFYDITLTQSFLEYGIWQDIGVGRELHHGEYERNQNHIEKHGRKREPRPWFSTKYYSSVMNLRDFMADSLGDEFKSMFCAALDIDNIRANTDYYKKRNYR